MITLYSYFRSSTAYRVRIGLHLKKLKYVTIPVNLAKGEHHDAAYKGINSMEAVPTLVHDDFKLTQSLAILNYIDNLEKTPPLAEGNFQELAYVRQIALTIATDIHPLTNLQILQSLERDYQQDESSRQQWYAKWATKGMKGVETQLRERGWSGDFALGNSVSVADLCIVPQMYNIRRYKLPLDAYPICRRIEANCMKIEAFIAASPEMQPDAPPGLEQIHGPEFKAT